MSSVRVEIFQIRFVHISSYPTMLLAQCIFCYLRSSSTHLTKCFSMFSFFYQTLKYCTVCVTHLNVIDVLEVLKKESCFYRCIKVYTNLFKNETTKSIFAYNFHLIPAKRHLFGAKKVMLLAFRIKTFLNIAFQNTK